MTSPKKQQGSVEQRVVDAVNKAIKKEVAAVLARGGFSSEVKEVIPTGIDVLDRHLLGIGGWPVGRASEVFGTEGAGKTALALQSLAGVQRIGGVGVLAETERASSLERARLYGVDPDKLILLEPECAEDAMEQLEATLHALPAKAGPVLLVYDSVAASPSRAEIDDGVVGKEAMGARARLLSKGARVLAGLVTKKRAHLMFINQVREEIGGYGYGFSTPGGHALKFYSSVRLQLVSGPAVKAGDQVVGRDVRLTVVKNKVAIPNRKATVRLRFESGFDDAWTTLNFAKDTGLVPEGAELTDNNVKRARSELGWIPADSGATTEGDAEETPAAPKAEEGR